MTHTPPLTDEQIDAFIANRLWVLRGKGAPRTHQEAARILRKLYRDREELRKELAMWKAAKGIDGKGTWISKARKETRG